MKSVNTFYKMRQQFNLELYKQHPDWKVETYKGKPVRIITCEAHHKDAPIVYLFIDSVGDECVAQTSGYDLLLVTPEPELTEFEQTVYEMVCDKTQAKQWAKELLELARKQIADEVKQQIIDEQTKVHDTLNLKGPEKVTKIIEDSAKCGAGVTVNGDEGANEWLTPFEQKIKDIMRPYVVIPDEIHRENAKELLDLARKELQPEIDAEVEKAYRTQDKVVYREGYKVGKAEALKDLPRWKKEDLGNPEVTSLIAGCLLHKGFYIGLKDLEKLPGFKEE